MNKRLDWVDAAKGIGILLVVMAHVPIPDSFKQFIYSFHMPLFFLLSGMMFRSSSQPAMSFIQKKRKACSYLISISPLLRTFSGSR